MVRFNRKSERGFTLVELLIVIAIIGVLSTIGVPAFKRMVQKSKKTEAKTNLGGVYTAEQAFFSEYGAYGNNLLKVGYLVDGTNNNLIYTVGFPGGATCTAPAAIAPAVGTTLGAAINTAFPAYYAPGLTTVANTPYSVSTAFTYNGSSGACFVANPTYRLKDGTNLTTPAIGILSYTPTGSTTSGNANGYIASASGVIASGVAKNTGNVADIDAWTIDHERTLVNQTDGVK